MSISQGYSQFRNFLSENRIIFETVTATLLSTMAIIIAVAQLRTASVQTSYLGSQTRIAEAQALPSLEIQLLPEWNSEKSSYDSHHLTVTNTGGPIRNVRAICKVLLGIEISAKSGFGPGMDLVDAEFAVNGYFSAGFKSNSSTGVLLTMPGKGNVAEIARLEQEVQDQVKQHSWQWATLWSPLVVLRLEYLDLLEHEHIEFYEVDPVRGGRPIPNASGKDAFERWNARPTIDLPTVSGEQLIAAAIPDD
jgi:hypothetical protein